MATQIPANDTFEQGTAQLIYPLEYLRGSHAGGYGESSPHLVYDSGDGYARFEDNLETVALWRRNPVEDARSKIRYQHKRVSGSAGNARLSGVLVRCSPSNVTAPVTATNTYFFAGIASGYIARVEDSGTVNLKLYRIVSGALTELASVVLTHSETTWYTLEIRVTTNLDLYGAWESNSITVLHNDVAQTGMDGLLDSNASAPTGAGMVGFSGTSINSGGNEVRTIFDYWRAESGDGSTVWIEDDFQRPDQALVTYGGKAHASLMWEFGDCSQIAAAIGSSQAPGLAGNNWVFDPGTPTSAYVGPFVDLYQLDPGSEDQVAGLHFRMDQATRGALHELGVVLKGSKSAQGTGIANFTGYYGLIRMSADGQLGLEIGKYSSGIQTVLATRSWTFLPNRWYQVQLEGEVNGAGYDLSASIRVNQSLVTVLTANDATKLAGNGQCGLLTRVYYAQGNSGKIKLRKWWMEAQAANPPSALAPVLQSVGELTDYPESPVKSSKVWSVVRHEFLTGHAQTLSEFRQVNVTWPVRWVGEASAMDLVYEFLKARARDALPFTLTDPDGTDQVWRLASPSIPYHEIAKNAWQVGPVDLVLYISPDSTP